MTTPKKMQNRKPQQKPASLLLKGLVLSMLTQSKAVFSYNKNALTLIHIIIYIQTTQPIGHQSYWCIAIKYCTERFIHLYVGIFLVHWTRGVYWLSQPKPNCRKQFPFVNADFSGYKLLHKRLSRKCYIKENNA